ncbi:MAG: GyrI-like domain-containing protein [Alphaproteobacteria bacterium]|nr:GyrI-like domain-containing protein [Alphaproteobacteria bacterium]
MEKLYDVNLKKIMPTKIMSIRKITSAEKLYADSEEVYRKLLAYIPENGGTLTKEVFTIYHNPEYNPEFIDIEYCFVVEELIKPTALIKARVTEEQLMASIIHKGEIKNTHFAYDVIVDWVKDNGYQVIEGGLRERYALPQNFDPHNVTIEILLPVEKKTEE